MCNSSLGVALQEEEVEEEEEEELEEDATDRLKNDLEEVYDTDTNRLAIVQVRGDNLCITIPWWWPLPVCPLGS